MLAACNTSKHSGVGKCTILKDENEKGLSFRKLESQDHIVDQQTASRGALDSYLISLATNGIKTLIDNRKKKYTAQFSMATSDLHFYNNISTLGTFDPHGIIFNGFTLLRLVDNDNNGTDTAFIAHFVLDTAKSYEIANSSMFRLKLASLDYRFSKAKYKLSTKKINIDFEITFSSSYVNQSGDFFSNITLGKFYYSVRNAPMDHDEEGYTAFYENLKNNALTGVGFIAPRSYGYYVSAGNALLPSYSWGNYSISAKVTESSKQRFVDKLIYDNSELIVNASKNKMDKKSKKVQSKNPKQIKYLK